MFMDYAFLPLSYDCYNFKGPTYAIEIKPKQGWIPVDDRHSKCHFCLNQHLKLKNSQIRDISGYCPLDLFSGNENRMTKALGYLIKNPQNNFKVFRNGFFVYGEHFELEKFVEILCEWFGNGINSSSKLIEEFCQLLLEALLKPFGGKGTSCCPKERDESDTDAACTVSSKTKEESCDYYLSNLPSNCILDRILSVQKLNAFGFQSYHALFEYLKINNKIDKWTYVNQLLSDVEANSMKCSSCVMARYNGNFSDYLQMNLSPNFGDEMMLVPYVVASIANDCSLMLTFRRVQENNVTDNDRVIRTRSGDFVVNGGIIDLYPKPLDIVKKHYLRNKKMIATYTQYVQSVVIG